jgi:hypothetical protein
VQYLGQIGTHAGTFARCKYQDFKLRIHSCLSGLRAISSTWMSKTRAKYKAWT